MGITILRRSLAFWWSERFRNFQHLLGNSTNNAFAFRVQIERQTTLGRTKASIVDSQYLEMKLQ